MLCSFLQMGFEIYCVAFTRTLDYYISGMMQHCFLLIMVKEKAVCNIMTFIVAEDFRAINFWAISLYS
jgi:hypothetical protein